MSARIRHGLFALAVLAGFPLVILTDALLARGYKKEDIAKIWG